MRLIKIALFISGAWMLSACDQASDSADQTARELTGSNMLQQEKALKQKLKGVQLQQQQRMQQLEQQSGE